MEATKTLVVILGPTASGKSALAAKLARFLGTDVISTDSRQFYKGMPIGTAWPSAEELSVAPHHFIGSHELEENISAADFERLALEKVNEIFLRNNFAVACGGTGLYIKALCEGLDPMPETDTLIEAEIDAEYQLKGIQWLQQRVQEEDPDFYATGEVQNPARLLRALAFKRSTATSITAFRTGRKKTRPFNIIKVGLELPRELLYERINRRVDIMMGVGFLEEAKALLPKKHLKNLATVGYVELFEYLEGICDLDFAIDKIKQHTRNYAKRQMTWFKKDAEISWFNALDEQLLVHVSKHICRS